MSTSYNCPACKIPLLVGAHSITIDRQRMEKERSGKIEDAAREVIEVPAERGQTHLLVDKALINKLREALE